MVHLMVLLVLITWVLMQSDLHQEEICTAHVHPWVPMFTVLHKALRVRMFEALIRDLIYMVPRIICTLQRKDPITARLLKDLRCTVNLKGHLTYKGNLLIIMVLARVFMVVALCMDLDPIFMALHNLPVQIKICTE
jgi:hypothetical protein